MDSMRSLNTSLPSTSKRKSSPQPDLHQAFRSAALTVTNLYKSAVADQAKAHSEGYQEALQDLIGFLDKENLGLGDGEGWSVRQWATERLDGALPTQPTSDSEEEGQDDKRARSSSPILERKQSPEDTRSSPPPRPLSPRPDSAPPMPAEAGHSPDTAPPRTDFTFRSPFAYPPTIDNDMEASAYPARAPMRVDVVRRSANRQQRSNGRNSSNLGGGAGTKRRHPLNDFFDLGGIWNDKRDGAGGPKRGRFS